MFCRYCGTWDIQKSRLSCKFLCEWWTKRIYICRIRKINDSAKKILKTWMTFVNIGTLFNPFMSLITASYKNISCQKYCKDSWSLITGLNWRTNDTGGIIHRKVLIKQNKRNEKSSMQFFILQSKGGAYNNNTSYNTSHCVDQAVIHLLLNRTMTLQFF